MKLKSKIETPFILTCIAITYVFIFNPDQLIKFYQNHFQIITLLVTVLVFLVGQSKNTIFGLTYTDRFFLFVEYRVFTVKRLFQIILYCLITFLIVLLMQHNDNSGVFPIFELIFLLLVNAIFYSLLFTYFADVNIIKLNYSTDSDYLIKIIEHATTDISKDNTLIYALSLFEIEQIHHCIQNLLNKANDTIVKFGKTKDINNSQLMKYTLSNLIEFLSAFFQIQKIESRQVDKCYLKPFLFANEDVMFYFTKVLVNKGNLHVCDLIMNYDNYNFTISSRNTRESNYYFLYMLFLYYEYEQDNPIIIYEYDKRVFDEKIYTTLADDYYHDIANHLKDNEHNQMNTGNEIQTKINYSTNNYYLLIYPFFRKFVEYTIFNYDKVEEDVKQLSIHTLKRHFNKNGCYAVIFLAVYHSLVRKDNTLKRDVFDSLAINHYTQLIRKPVITVTDVIFYHNLYNEVYGFARGVNSLQPFTEIYHLTQKIVSDLRSKFLDNDFVITSDELSCLFWLTDISFRLYLDQSTQEVISTLLMDILRSENQIWQKAISPKLRKHFELFHPEIYNFLNRDKNKSSEANLNQIDHYLKTEQYNKYICELNKIIDLKTDAIKNNNLHNKIYYLLENIYPVSNDVYIDVSDFYVYFIYPLIRENQIDPRDKQYFLAGAKKDYPSLDKGSILASILDNPGTYDTENMIRLYKELMTPDVAFDFYAYIVENNLQKNLCNELVGLDMSINSNYSAETIVF